LLHGIKNDECEKDVGSENYAYKYTAIFWAPAERK
jgi:hypothetical protein